MQPGNKLGSSEHTAAPSQVVTALASKDRALWDQTLAFRMTDKSRGGQSCIQNSAPYIATTANQQSDQAV